MKWPKFFEKESGAGEVENQKDRLDLEIDNKSKRKSPIFSFSYKVEIYDESQIGTVALALASTSTVEEEKKIKDVLKEYGWKAVATEVGGLVDELPAKITRAVVGAALNGKVVEKRQSHMHALMHATVEAMDGFLQASLVEASVGAKIAIVRNSKWIAVAIVGDAAYHAIAHHERAGLGTMHI